MPAHRQTASVQARLARIEQLLGSDPKSADEQATELLAAEPGQPMALLFQGIARRLIGNPAAAVEVLTDVCERWPDAPLAHLQLGLALRAVGRSDSAVQSMRRAVAVKADFSDAWLAMADLLTEIGSAAEADEAFVMYVKHSARDPRLLGAATALRQNRVGEAESLLQSHLERHSTDVAALCMLADVAARHARLSRAESLLKRCLELAPSYSAARHNHAVVLMRQNKLSEALQEVDHLSAKEGTNRALRSLRASILVRLGEHEQAIEVFEGILAEHPDQPRMWTSLGHELRTIGRTEQSIASYRKALEIAPDFGEAYWSLANLKTYDIPDSLLEPMRVRTQDPRLSDEDRIHFSFALGKALEDRKVFNESFEHYAEGNRLRRRQLGYNPDDFSAFVAHCRLRLVPGFFAERAGYGTDSADPIFVVGLPRAGSTLVEQILASHPAVEGTAELPHAAAIAKSLASRDTGVKETQYIDVLAKMDEEEFRALGDSYIEQTRVQRKRGTPFFIDKMPNNFAHLGLIHLILPNARIIDVRRHPLACGLSIFKHLFAHGQNFSYSLEDIGRYYRDYVDLMTHLDRVLPGRVHRVIYERLVSDTESEVRRLLDYCGLPFERSCLSFYENKRAVSTPSSEQVRAPVFREAIDHWKNFEPWLAPLQEQLGQLVNTYAGYQDRFDAVSLPTHDN